MGTYMGTYMVIDKYMGYNNRDISLNSMGMVYNSNLSINMDKDVNSWIQCSQVKHQELLVDFFVIQIRPVQPQFMQSLTFFLTNQALHLTFFRFFITLILLLFLLIIVIFIFTIFIFQAFNQFLEFFGLFPTFIFVIFTQFTVVSFPFLLKLLQSIFIFLITPFYDSLLYFQKLWFYAHNLDQLFFFSRQLFTILDSMPFLKFYQIPYEALNEFLQAFLQFFLFLLQFHLAPGFDCYCFHFIIGPHLVHILIKPCLGSEIQFLQQSFPATYLLLVFLEFHNHQNDP